MIAEICGDNRFEIIEAAKKKLIEATNIETSSEEMAVLDNILFRMWQMDWLPVHAHWIIRKEFDSLGGYYGTSYTCSRCKHLTFKRWNFCPDCGAKMCGEILDEPK